MANATAQRNFAFSTISVTHSQHTVALVSTCPNQSGVLDSISVPVSMPLTLFVVSFSPAPKGGVTFQLSSANSAVVVAGNAHDSFAPEVTIPEGSTKSDPFTVLGVSVGATTLNAIALTPGFPGFSTPIGAWDVSPGANANLSKFLDANPPQGSNCRVTNGASLSTDPNVLATCGRPVIGTMSDGATQLLMRMVSGLGGTACYNLVSSSPPDQGTIAAPVVSTQTVGDLNYGFSFYQAPDAYGDTSATRQVQVQFVFTPNIGNGNTTSFTNNLTVVRPPLMLIHGVWADSSSFPDNIWIRSPGFLQPNNAYFVFKGDYEATHDASFTTNFGKVQGYIAKALILARAANYAATKADVVAHSMGGLLTRLYVASANYMRPTNYNLGDIHRFITLDTPYGGSNFASLLVALHTTNPADVENSVHSLVGATASVTNGSVCDLSENSQGLVPLATPTNLLSQVITATGGPAGTPTSPAKFFGGRGPLGGDFEAELTKCLARSLLTCTQYLYDQTTIDAFRFRQANDAIVPLCSQQGGVSGTSCPAGGTAGINFTDLLHFVATTFTGVTNSTDVAKLAFSLLDGPTGGFVSSIPGLASNGTGAAVTTPGLGAARDAHNFTSQCLTGSPPPMKQNIAGSITGRMIKSAIIPDSRVKVTSPANGQVFAPGDSVTIEVSLAPGLVANNVEISLPGFGSAPGTGFTGSSYQLDFTIPGFFAGPLQIVPTVRDASNNLIVGITTTVAVRPTTAPLSLSLSQASDVLTSVGDTDRIHVTGNYPDDLTLDLTSSASGTTYKSSNTKVLTVDTEGNVTATGFGTAVLTVANFGVQVFGIFSVEDPDHPLSPQDFSSQVNTASAGFRVDRNTGFFDQTVQWTNTQTIPVIGPLYFVPTSLPAGVTLIGAGTTQNITPAGSPYFTLLLPDGITLQPGASVSQVLRFLNPSRTRIAYSPKIFRSLEGP